MTHATDLGLARECLLGDAAAQTLLVTRYHRAVRAALVRVGIAADELPDLEQHLWQRMLMGREGARPALSRYRGRGSLAAWLGTCAYRDGLILRRARAARPRECELLDEHPGHAAADPEHEALRREAGFAFSRALCDALAALGPDERRLLREHAVDRCGLGELATAHGVHRTTVFRRLERIKSLVRRRTTRALREPAAGAAAADGIAAQWSATSMRLSQVLGE